ncbi:LysE family translocator [Arenibaculum sp.]|uniref:LysE family translocator n=1 Tax=Arenibaculum sp. TaxID=2865862 RepID=UPI002E161BFB|nr:LysE family translocator [Arenibaculum sp.]
MPNLPTFLTFYAAVLALQLAPGPDMALVIARGVGQGRRTAFLSAVGMTALAGMVQLPLLAFGVASLVQASPLAFDLLRWTGAAYLAWLGVRLLLRAGRHRVAAAGTASRVSDAAALREGMISNLANPKPMVFMLAFLPQFVDPANGWPVTAQMLALGAVQKASGLVILGSIALGVGTLGGWLARRPGLLAWQERLAGLAMMVLGLHLALTGDGRSVRS